ncbi:TetR family transcriptional regulator [Verrucosispora sp. WMMA2044]|uniref:Helix-turn-helix transcriptional regulator n=1 Tax=Verrucosispora sioxanthis TaxID=2499994 RepID=A0A6M1LAZ7_9ACTN|nr:MULTISPECIES: TetR family transcriptional regulator [Micromonospora]NEE66290.1 helix-turn-helix transcriptional regulator [Verrucosispora sioxanthis]NGM15400.1 helix-turn-helix transcriptional regulator [Verrucosispora sioxanthis]WBB49861.1 TetR family transcriptional regulator [Verrucosispora sp. WMMA2044]
MDEVKDGKATRPYRSRIREENARRTRQAVVAAATELFVARGYTATSLADVAAAAGVARPTVFAAFGSKAALLRQVLDEALAGDDEPVPVAQRPWYRPVWEATTGGEVLDAYAGICTLIGARTTRVFETVRRAADGSPEVAEVWRTLLSNRRLGATMVVERMRALDARLRQGSDVEAAIDEVWFYNDPAHYGALVLERGWREETFRRWLGRSLRHALLSDPD